ncbi:MAG: hypothetical protein PHY02_01255 [Phycisphaerae bacterium]|nr:hypothetical protein [Phycisphaerae bacterium]
MPKAYKKKASEQKAAQAKTWSDEVVAITYYRQQLLPVVASDLF